MKITIKIEGLNKEEVEILQRVKRALFAHSYIGEFVDFSTSDSSQYALNYQGPVNVNFSVAEIVFPDTKTANVHKTFTLPHLPVCNQLKMMVVLASNMLLYRKKYNQTVTPRQVTVALNHKGFELNTSRLK